MRRRERTYDLENKIKNLQFISEDRFVQNVIAVYERPIYVYEIFGDISFDARQISRSRAQQKVDVFGADRHFGDGSLGGRERSEVGETEHFVSIECLNENALGVEGQFARRHIGQCLVQPIRLFLHLFAPSLLFLKPQHPRASVDVTAQTAPRFAI